METNFGKILKDRRNRVGMKQEELAWKIGTANSYISKLEGEHSNPSYSKIKELCDALGLTLEQFFRGKEEAKSEPAIIEIYKNSKNKEEIKKKYRVKTELIPIEVVNGLKAFARERNIEEEFSLKYIYVEKTMFDKPQNIIGVEIDKDLVLSSIRFNRTILLVDTEKKSLVDSGFYIIQFSHWDYVTLMSIEREGNKFVFFQESSTSKQKKPSNFPREYKIYLKSELEPDIVRGKVVGIFGRF